MPDWNQKFVMRELHEDRERLLTVSEVAGILRVKDTTVRDWLRKDSIQGYRLPAGWRISAGDLLDFIERHRKKNG